MLREPAPPNPYIPSADSLLRLAETDPALFPPEVLQLYASGQRVLAHAALRKALPLDPVREETRRGHLENLRLWAQPCRPPSMATLNSVGVSAAGRVQPAPDGTYILTTFFVVFFVPMSPSASYLVLDGSKGWRRSWYFLAQVPIPDNPRSTS